MQVAFQTFVVVICQVTSALDTDAAFQDRFEKLRRQNPAAVGRESIVRGYENLILEHPQNPRIAEAMFNIASLLGTSNPAAGVKADRPAALAWYRKAAQAAEPGSEVWKKARLAVANRAARVERTEQAAEEASKLLEEVAAGSDGDSYTLARVEQGLMSQAIRKGKRDEAERRALALLHWYDDPAKIPHDKRQKELLDDLIAGAASAMMQSWSSAPIVAQERTAGIERVLAEKGDFKNLDEVANRAKQRATSAGVPSFAYQATAPPSSDFGLARKLVLWLNVAGVIALAVLVARRILAARRASAANGTGAENILSYHSDQRG